jgi:uncharacterized protein with PIN domain
MKPVKVNLTMPEVYRELCPVCKAALEKVVQEKISQQIAKKILEGK